MAEAVRFGWQRLSGVGGGGCQVWVAEAVRFGWRRLSGGQSGLQTVLHTVKIKTFRCGGGVAV